MNSFNNNTEFLKKMKKNKSLEELYLNQSDIGNNEINDILRIINLTNIKTLYLYKTKINDFNKFLTILYTSKTIKEQRDDAKNILAKGSSLVNLDLSNNIFNNININHIDLLTKIIKETSLYSLDISNILYKKDENKNSEIIRYNIKVKELIKMLNDDKEK